MVLAMLKGKIGSKPGEWGHLAGQGEEDHQRLAEGRAMNCCKEMVQVLGVKTCFVVQLDQHQEVQVMRGGPQRKEAEGVGCERESSWLVKEDLGDDLWWRTLDLMDLHPL